MRRLAKQFELGGQHRDTHICLGAREVRLKCLSLISSFRQSLKRFSLLGSHWRDRVQFFNHGGGKRRGEEDMSALSCSVLILGYVGTFAYHLIDRYRDPLGVFCLRCY